MAVLVYIVLLLALSGHSNALYCVCKDGVGDQALQTALDYACGAGADCTPILQNGACYQPNTVKDHCNWAVNSYYQRKGQVQGSCDFAGTATVSQTAPTTSSSCVYPASSSNTGTPTTTPTTGTPSTTPTTTTTTSPTSGTGTGTGTGTTTGTSPSIFGISPSSTSGTTGINDNSSAGLALLEGTKSLFYLTLAFWLVALFRV